MSQQIMPAQTVRRTIRGVLLACSAACGAWAGSAWAEPARVPETPAAVGDKAVVDNRAADAIIDRFVEVTGGRAAYDAVKSRRTTMEMSIPAQNMTMQVTSTQKDATTGKVEVNIVGMGKVVTGRVGDILFEVNEITNTTRLIDGPEAEQMKRSLTLNEVETMKSMFPVRQLIGRQDVDGKPADLVEFSSPTAKLSQWYDVETGLVVQNQMTVPTQMGQLDVKSTISDYKDFGGIKIATLMKQNMMGAEVVIKTLNVENNIAIDAAEMTVPEAVQKLVDEAAKK